MILAHGCARRLLVLAAPGDLHSLLSELRFDVTAQSALTPVPPPRSPPS